MLAVVDPVDDTYRRAMNRQLTVQESRHTLARTRCNGRRGQIHQAYREGQEDQLGALGLVLNAVVLWNSRYLDAAVHQLRAQGEDEDVARLSHWSVPISMSWDATRSQHPSLVRGCVHCATPTPRRTIRRRCTTGRGDLGVTGGQSAPGASWGASVRPSRRAPVRVSVRCPP
jgi:hypothetical protein